MGSPGRRLGALSLLLPVLLARRATEAQLRLGAEFQVNSYTTSTQAAPAIASDPAGNFVVVWSSLLQNGSFFGVFGQRYAGSGARLGTEFQVSSYTTSDEAVPAIASDPAGNFVVVWNSNLQDGSSQSVFGQRYASSGAPLGTEFQVNSYTTNSESGPAIAVDPAGNFVVVWSSFVQDGGSQGVFGQRFAGSGARLGTEFRVNSYTTFNQKRPAIASDSAGNFVVVWESGQDGSGPYGVFGQRYASLGAPLGTEFQVNSYTTFNQQVPVIASDPAGNFVVVWVSFYQDGSSIGVFGQRYASSGARLGTEFQVNSYTTDIQSLPKIASDPTGTFVVVWQSKYQDGSGYGVLGQRYASSGAPLGAEFRVNSYTTNYQFRPAIASDPAGNFVVVWHSNGQDGSSYGVFAQRYCQDPLSAVSVSSTGSLAVCTTSMGGTVTVTDTGGGADLHQWFYRALPAGMYQPINSQTGTTYIISGADFGFPGLYAVVCRTTPTLSCGTPIISAENVQVTVTQDNTPPSVTAPTSLTTTQSICQ